MSYEELELEWGALINKFSNKYTIPGYDIEDIEQELRMVLLKTQKNYDPNKGIKFITYLYSSFDNRMHQLYTSVQGFKKHIPSGSIYPISLLMEGWEDNKSRDNELSTDTEITEGLGNEARKISNLILAGFPKQIQWKQAGLTNQEINTGIIELKEALIGGRK